MAFCTKCGGQVAVTDGFCGKCGAAKFKSADKKKSPLASKIVLGMVGVLVLLALIGIFAPDPNQSKPSASTAASPFAAMVPDAAEQAYSLDMAKISGYISESMTRFIELTQAPRPDDILWRSQVSAQFSIWQAGYADAQNLRRRLASRIATPCF